MQNFGLIEQKEHQEDYIAGADTGLILPIVASDRDWSDVLPIVEYQKDYSTGWDSYGCVSFSELNVHETYAKAMHSMEWNKSDRFVVVGSGTRPNKGNSMRSVAEFTRKKGLVNEASYPFGVGTQKDFYKKPLPQSLYDEGAKFLDEWELKWDWVGTGGVSPEALYEALGCTPLQVTLLSDSSVPIVNGVYRNPGTKNTNHAVMIYKAIKGDRFFVFDHYTKSKKEYDWNFYFGSAMRHVSIKKEPKKEEPKVPQKTPSKIIYTVKSGDTLSKIAKLYNTTVQSIATQNNIKNVNLIRVGQTLVI